MQALSAARVLELSERCAEAGTTGKALELLAAGSPETDRRALAELPLGVRDLRLLALRAQTLGDPLRGLSRCPACGAALEFELTSGDLLGAADAGPAELSATLGELALELRQPNSFDLLAAEEATSSAEAQSLLVERCVRGAHRQGRAITPAELTEQEVEALGEKLARSASALELCLRFECADCGNAWTEQFDVAEFFSAELSAVAERLVDEVHALARSYGWRESEILAMSAHRRRRYLERLSR